MELETVKIKVSPTVDIPDGFIVINATDFVEGKDTLFGAPEVSVVKEVEQAAAPVPPAPPVDAKPWEKKA